MNREDRLVASPHGGTPESVSIREAERAEWEWYLRIYDKQMAAGIKLPLHNDSFLPAGFMPYWLKKNGKVIGGAALSGSAIRDLFTISPHQVDHRLILAVVKAIRETEAGGGTRTIRAYEVFADQEDAYMRAGFFPAPHRHRWMQRPTAEYDSHGNGGSAFQSVEIQNEGGERRLVLEREIGLFLFKHAWHEEGTKLEDASFADVLSKLRLDAAHMTEETTTASSLLYDTSTRALIGVCIIGMLAGCPTIQELTVMRAYRGRGLATQMVQKALTMLKKQELPLLRIRAMHGHPHESLCFQLGFMPGPLFISTMTMYG
ncbi:GNAT family N-acetyltransferase [Paenibacillus favisporus]|uniref:GNAT family N-acetyltransferase n=1 Tax=Paenibacillus favisporus TaxID=221028 RepID=UPI003D2B7E73